MQNNNINELANMSLNSFSGGIPQLPQSLPSQQIKSQKASHDVNMK